MAQHEPLVLITNVYSYQELGDNAIIEAMVAYIRAISPGARIYLISQFWQENEEHYRKLGCCSIPPLWNIPMDDKKIRRGVTALWSLVSAIMILWTRRLGRSAEGPPSEAKLYREASLVIDAGGGTLFSSNKYLFYLGLYQHLFNLRAAKLFGKPVIIGPQSIGPLTRSIDENVVGAVLRKMDLVMVREPISAALLENIHVPYTLVPDTVFLGNFISTPSPMAQKYLEKIDGKYLNVGVTVMDWRWAIPGALKSRAPLMSYLRKVASAVCKAGKLQPMRVVVFVHVTTRYRDNDLEVSLILKELISNDISEVLLVQDVLSPSDFCYLYKAMDLVVGTRFHSNIFAMMQGVPTLGLSYQPKTKGTFELLGLREYVLDVLTFSAEELLSKINEMSHDRGILRLRFSEAAQKAREKVEQQFNDSIRPYLVIEK